MKVVMAIVVIVFFLLIGIVVVFVQFMNILKNMNRDRG